ncbi:deoxyribodipyrimidine photo-lyase [Rhizobium beringeri]
MPRHAATDVRRRHARRPERRINQRSLPRIRQLSDRLPLSKEAGSRRPFYVECHDKLFPPDETFDPCVPYIHSRLKRTRTERLHWQSDTAKPVILWFRKDLRLDDNRALHAVHRSGRPVIPLYISGTGVSRHRSAGRCAGLVAASFAGSARRVAA